MDELRRRACLEALYRRHGADVLAYARRRTDTATAADVFSDVFVVAWQRLDAIPADPLPWLLGCARRALLNHHRAARRRSKLIERLAVNARRPSPWPDVHGGRLAEALGLLSEVDREVLLLTAWEGLSTKQSASVLGCSTQAFKVRAYRARKRLADALLNVDGLPPLSQEACNG